MKTLTTLTSVLAVLLAIMASSSAHPTSTPYLPKRLIALEEHAMFPSLSQDTPFNLNIFQSFPAAKAKLQNLSEGRIADMDLGYVTVQVLSQLPGMGSANVTGCRGANNELAQTIAAHPTRFSGFAVLPMAFPSEAAAELERAVTDLGLVGAMIDNHLADGTYYDDETYWPVFETAERLDVPIYIHPSPPSQAAFQQQFAGNYPVNIAGRLGASAWGWHVDAGLHIVRLYTAGLFDRYPKLKIILGHEGENLPMMIDRIDDNRLRNGTTFGEVWDRNIWVTVAGFFHLRTFEMLLKVTKPERIMYSVDYPFVAIEQGWAFVQELAKSGLLSQEEMDQFAYGTAGDFLRLRK